MRDGFVKAMTMNTIEQHLHAEDTVLQIVLPEEWKGQNVKVTIELEKQPSEKPKLSRLRGALKHLSSEQRADMDRQLNMLRDEWERAS